MRRISAAQLVTVEGGGARLAGEMDRDPIEGRVVMIGATHADTGDFYNTPLGTMPGVLIIANSIVAAEAITGTAPMKGWLANVLTLILFLIFAYIVRHLDAALAVIAIGIISLVALFVISRLFSFYDGVNVVTIAVPGFALFKLIDSIAQIALYVPSRGWKALLKK